MRVDGVTAGWQDRSPGIVGREPRTLEEAATAFEGLLLGQLLKTAREASGGWDEALEEGDGRVLREYAEEYLARELAVTGVGVARQVLEQMKADQDVAPDLSRSAEP